MGGTISQPFIHSVIQSLIHDQVTTDGADLHGLSALTNGYGAVGGLDQAFGLTAAPGGEVGD